ncbi:hypothetical protein EJB05_06414, partial [Eragrostis curvula]
MTVLLSFVNYAGLSVVGWGAVALGVVSLAPFVLMTAMAAPMVRPRRWAAQVQGSKDWRLFFNILFWNLNYWDSASTMAGEVERPEHTFPRALAVAVVLIVASYLLPLMAATGATDAPPEAWVNGYLAEAAGVIGGAWLKYWIDAGAVLSSIGMFEAQLSSGAYQLLGMSDLGLLPAVFARRAAGFGTPWVAIAVSGAITLAVSFLGFDDVVATANFLYGLGTLLEFAAFLWLRASQPDLKRPFRVPLPLPALVAMCAVPSAFLAYVSTVAGTRVFVLAGAFTALGVAGHGAMRVCRARKWLSFNDTGVAEEKITVCALSIIHITSMDTRRTATATADRAVRPALDTAPRHPAPYGLSVPLGPNEPLPLNAPGGPNADGGLPNPPAGGPNPPPAGGVKPVGGVVPNAGGLKSDGGGLEPNGGVKPVGGARLVGGLAPTGVVELEPPPAVELQTCQESDLM